MKLILALAAGVGLYYFLGTEKGKDLVAQAKDGACDLTKNLFKKGKDVMNDVKEQVA